MKNIDQTPTAKGRGCIANTFLWTFGVFGSLLFLLLLLAFLFEETVAQVQLMDRITPNQEVTFRCPSRSNVRLIVVGPGDIKDHAFSGRFVILHDGQTLIERAFSSESLINVSWIQDADANWGIPIYPQLRRDRNGDHYDRSLPSGEECTLRLTIDQGNIDGCSLWAYVSLPVSANASWNLNKTNPRVTLLPPAGQKAMSVSSR